MLRPNVETRASLGPIDSGVCALEAEELLAIGGGMPLLAAMMVTPLLPIGIAAGAFVVGAGIYAWMNRR